MGKSATESIWLPCPQCGSRIEVRQASGEPVRCNHCGRKFAVKGGKALERAAAASAEGRSATQAPFPASTKVDDELTVAPVPALTGYKATVPKPEQVVERGPHESYVAPPARASLLSTMFAGVFDYPFRLCAFAQWLLISIGLILAGELGMIALMGLLSGSQPGALSAGCFGLGTFFLSLLALSYATASMLSIIENTAYNLDNASDWPDPDWRERMFVMLRVGYVGVAAVLAGAAIAWAASRVGEVEMATISVAVAFFVFPIMLLSMLESNSMWLLSWPIWRSVATSWYVWAMFYAVAACVWAAWWFVTKATFDRSSMLAPVVGGPLWAAALFVYSRLLGRLTWLLMSRAEVRGGRSRADLQTGRGRRA